MAVSRRLVGGPELIFGLVGAVGTDLILLGNLLKGALSAVNYSTTPIRLIHLLRGFRRWRSIPDAPADEYIRRSMDAGNEFRELMRHGGALALLGVGRIRDERFHKHGSEDKVIRRRAYILRSLKNPNEVVTLRKIYGDAFILIAAYASHQRRLEYLTKRIADSKHEFDIDQSRAVAEQLIQRDQEEPGNKLGQNVRDTFHRADVFFDATDADRLSNSINRFVELLFGHPYVTPIRDEFGMFHAKAAALRSAEMGRQVGAAVTNDDGDVLCVGTNEVPKAGGGLYWEGDDPDERDFVQGEDSNDKHKRSLLADILNRLHKERWLRRNIHSDDIQKRIEQALDGEDSPLLKSAQLMNLLEFGRAVHAEMAALTTAARLGIRVVGCNMYTSTFPCHICARHIVAAGIKRVVYIEPYAKSLAAQLYPDSISLDPGLNAANKVPFEPFVGVSPRRYLSLFAMQQRKTPDGKRIHLINRVRIPRCDVYPASYLYEEKEKLDGLNKKIHEVKLALNVPRRRKNGRRGLVKARARKRN